MKLAASFHAIHDCELNKTFSLAEFEHDVKAARSVLLTQFNLKPKDKVAYFGNNSYHFFVTLFACSDSDISFAPLPQNLTPRETEEALSCISPNLIFDSHLFKKRDVANAAPIAGLIMLSSGSTGKPKAFLHSWKKVAQKLEYLQNVIPSKDLQSSLCLLPTSFGHGLIGNSLLPLSSGGTLYLQKPFSSHLRSLDTTWINEKRITFLSSVPLTWTLWASLETAPMMGLKRVHIASAPLQSKQFESARKLAPNAEIYNVFGMTELLSWCGAKKITKIEQGNIGSIWGYDWRVENQELLIKSEHLYDLELTADNGYSAPNSPWLPTGDLVFVNDHRDIILQGRSKRQINRAGLKVSPEEIENQLSKNPAILDCAVTSISDDSVGDLIIAFIVTTTHQEDAILRQWLTKELSISKLPDKIIQLDKIPRTDRGKTDYRQLQKLIKQI